MDTLTTIMAEMWATLLSGTHSLWESLVRAFWWKRWVGWTLLSVTGIAAILMTLASFLR